MLFGKWSGTEVKIDGQDLLIMKEADIMGVIEHQPLPRKRPEWIALHEEIEILEFKPWPRKT